MTRSLALRHALLRTLVTGAAAIAAAAPTRALGAQEARPAALPAPRPVMSAVEVEERLRVIADPSARANIAATITAAGEQGLPMSPLVTKALEGVEKGAPPARIAAAVRAMAGRLAVASQALAPVLTVREVESGADALGAGVPPDVLREIRAVAMGRSTAVALGVVAQLTARGVPASKAGAAVAVLVKGGASSAHLQSLERMVKEDLAVGVSPSTALDLRMRTLTSALPPTYAPPAASTSDAIETMSAPGTQRTTPATPTTPRRRP